MALQVFAFNRGLHEEVDARLNEPGTPREIANLIRTKTGRLRPRRDYETLAMTLPLGSDAGGGTGLQLFDLHAFGERLIGLGDSLHNDEPAKVANAAVKAFTLVETPDFAWIGALQPFMSCLSQLRDVDGLVTIPEGISNMDCAAGNGLVCNVYDIVLGASTYSTVHIFDPATGATIFERESGSNTRSQTRVCFCGSSFFITSVVTADNSIELLTYDTSNGDLTVETSPVGAGASIVAYDLSAAHEGTSAWIAVARSDTTTALRGLDTGGTVTYTTAGPAVLGDAISIIAHSLVSATLRIHVCIVRDTTLNVDVYSYTPPTTTPYASSTDLMTTRNATTQVGLAVCEVGGGATTQFLAIWNDGDDLFWRKVNCTTHAITSEETRANVRINSKPRAKDGLVICGFTIPEGSGALTSAMLEFQRISTFAGTSRPGAVLDRLIAANATATHLPTIADDSSTDLSYWLRPVNKGGSPSQPRTTEFVLGGTERRQTAHLGNILYIAGGVPMAHDGRGLMEAGGFLIRPVIMSATGAGGGSKTLLATYQLVAKYELVDALGNVTQSAPSDVTEVTLAGGENAINALVSGPLSFVNNIGGTVRFPLYGRILYQVYSTLPTDDGNITFHFSDQNYSSSAYQSIEVTVVVNESDADLSDEEVLYSQGARGSLSGPLEFIPPDPCTSLAASADRILTGGLPRESSTQESRPLLVEEQAQWNNSFAFYRDARGRILAVARLDERRILFTAGEIFEVDGPGVDDNGLGEIGAPRRLPSDVGLYGGAQGWCSIVEMSAGILFRGLRTQIYLLPRGGVTPIPIGFAVEDKLGEYPDITAAVYTNEDQTVRFTCNNEAGTESIVLLLNVRFMEWFVEGPYSFAIRAAARAAGRFYLLTSLNTVLRQREEDTPLVFVPYSWRGTPVHPGKPGMFFRTDAFWLYGTVRGDCRVRCIAQWDEDEDTRVEHEWIDVVGRDVGSQFRFRFEFEQTKCENVMVDFEIEDFQDRPSSGLDLTYWAIEGEPSNVPNQVEPEAMT